MSSFIQSSHERLGEILSRQRTYRVPFHQRDYSWSDDQVEQFWDDVRSAIDGDAQEHFMGAIVFQEIEEDRDYEVIDGQQRLATTLALLAAIRETYRSQNDDLWHEIQSAYFGRTDRKTRKTVCTFRMNSENDPLFQKHVANPSTVESVRKAIKARGTRLTNKRLLSAYLFFIEKLQEQTDCEAGFRSEVLADLEEFLLKKLSAILVVVSDEADAFTLFETLNERGLELSILDLVKNHLFGRAREKVEAVKKNWFEMTGELDDRHGVRFLRHYWVSRNGRVQATRLFRAIRESLGSKTAAVRFSSELRDGAAVYTALSNADHPLWDAYGSRASGIRSSISTLQALNAVQCYPVLLAAHEVFRESHFAQLLNQMVAMAVRYSLICQYRTGALEIGYADIAARITRKQIKTAAQAFSALRELYPSDDAFRAAFENRDLRTAKHARFVLRQLEAFKASGETSPASDGEVVSLEHVAPKSPVAGWKSLGVASREEYDDWVHRIGNQVLLNRKINRELGARPFSEKKKEYAKSRFKLTQSVGRSKGWAKSSIAARQKRLAKIAVDCWRYDA